MSSSETLKPIKLDDILEILGKFGKYQKRVFVLLCLPAICCAMHGLGWVLLAPKVASRCQLNVESENSEFSNFPPGIAMNSSIPLEISNGEFSQCERYDIDYMESTDVFGNTTFVNKIDSAKNGSCKVSCGGKYLYDKSTYSSSARIDFELVCDRKYLYTLEETAYKGGVLVGSLLFGDLSDRFGRRPILLSCISLQLFGGIVASLAPNYDIFVFSRAAAGAASMGVFLVAFVMAVEMVGPSKRKFVGVMLGFFWTLGYLAAGILSYFIKDWRMLYLSFSLPSAAFIFYYWILPESVRWLLNHDFDAEAKKILRKAAKVNQVTLTEQNLKSLVKDSQGSSRSLLGALQLFRSSRLALRTIVVFLCWFVCSSMYYGLSLNTGNLGGNAQINFLIAGAVEIPGALLNMFTLDRFGRKRALCTFMILGGTMLVACSMIPAGLNTLIVAFAMFGKMCIFAAFGAIYIFSAELYPTVVRNGGMGASSLCARVGSILSDYVLLLGEIWKPLPLIIFGAMSISSGLLCLTLPETLGKRLPETIDDAELFGTQGYDNDDQTMKSDDKNCNVQEMF